MNGGVITSLRQAIAEAEQDGDCKQCGGKGCVACDAREQEPVIDKSAAIRIATALGWEPKREWVGLTDEEIDLLEELYAPPVHPDFVNDADHCLELIHHVEAKLKEKNT